MEPLKAPEMTAFDSWWSSEKSPPFSATLSPYDHAKAAWQAALAASPQAEAQREGGQWTEREREALDELMKLTDLSEHGVLRQGLRVYQLIVKGSHVLASPPSGEPGPPPIIGPDGDHHTQEWFDGYEEARMHFELPVPRASDESGERLREARWWHERIGLNHGMRWCCERISELERLATPAPSEGNESARELPADLVTWLDDNLVNEEDAPFERRAELMQKAFNAQEQRGYERGLEEGARQAEEDASWEDLLPTPESVKNAKLLKLNREAGKP